MPKYSTRVSLTVTVSPNTKRVLDEESKKLELPISRIIDAWAREKDSGRDTKGGVLLTKKQGTPLFIEYKPI